MSRLARPAGRLATGSQTVARRLATRAAAWCARGRRDDLTGWRGALGIILRLVLLTAGVYLLARLVRALPALMWLLTAWWVAASWRAGKPTAKESACTPEEMPLADAGRETLRGLLLDLMGSGSGVHLSTVLAHLQEHGQWKGRTVTDLRLHLARLQVPHDRGVKIAGVPTWGVRRRDLEAPSPGAVQEPSTAPSTAA